MKETVVHKSFQRGNVIEIKIRSDANPIRTLHSQNNIMFLCLYTEISRAIF